MYKDATNTTQYKYLDPELLAVDQEKLAVAGAADPPDQLDPKESRGGVEYLYARADGKELLILECHFAATCSAWSRW